MLAVEFVNKCRSYYPSLPTNDLLSQVEARLTIPQDASGSDINEDFRWEVCRELKRSLQKADRDFVRYLLEQEISLQTVLWAVNHTIQTCVEMLYQFEQLEDSLLIWKAKTTNFDTSIAVDVEGMLGAGLDNTIRFLKEQGTQEALDALVYIERRSQSGAFANLDQRPRFRKVQLQ